MSLKKQQPSTKAASSPSLLHYSAAAADDDDNWLDSCTNHHVIASSYQGMVDDPWNHPLLMDDDEDFFEASKRVSLDATETWMTDDDPDFLLDPHLILFSREGGVDEGGAPFAALPSSISFQPDDDDEDMLNVLDGSGSETDSWHSQFRERRAQLAASMAASQSTRSLLSQHVKTRASLQQVLQDIEKSTTQIQKHIVIESVGMAVDETSSASAPALPAVSPEAAAVDTEMKDANDATITAAVAAEAIAMVDENNDAKPAAKAAAKA